MIELTTPFSEEAIRELMERLKIIQRKRKTLLFEENEGDE